jgi:hypothetical protein
MLAFGVTALRTRRFDTDVPRIFFDSIYDIESEQGLPRGEHLFGNDHIWPYLMEMYEGYIGQTNELALQRDGWRSAYSVVSYLARHYDISRQQLEQIHWQPFPDNLSGWGVDVSLMADEIAARTGSAKDDINAAELRRNQGNLASALPLYRKVAAASNVDSRTANFAKDRLLTLDIEQRLSQGGWVDFLPPAGQPAVGWCVARGRIQRLPDDRLEVTSGPGGHIVYSRARIGTSFEVKGRFEVVKISSGTFQGGLVMGTPDFDTFAWYAFRVKRHNDEGDVASFSQHWSRKQILSPASLNNDVNSFEFRFQNGHVNASVNGKKVFQTVSVPKNQLINTNEFLLGLGAFNDMNESIIRSRDVQVRRIPPAESESRQINHSAGSADEE